VIVLLPRSWKSSTKMALRNIGRQRARTTTTMLALFVGVFTIGLILILGQDLHDTINKALARSSNYNVVALTTGDDAATLQSRLGTIPGLTSSQHRNIAPVVPVSINGQPLQSVLPPAGSPEAGGSINSLGRDGALYFLSGLEGYDVANNQFPDTKNFAKVNGHILEGRNLDASDAGTNNVLIAWQLAHLDPLKGKVKLGSTITFASIDSKTTRTVTVVGIYFASGFGSTIEPILATADTVKALSPAGLEQTIFYMKIDPNQAAKAVGVIGNIAPNATVRNLADIGAFIDQAINDLLLTLTTIASLSLLAGVLIIANAVALAMLERRRELGILKSVGYTSGTVLREVRIENGVVGGTGALLAMLVVTLAIGLLSRFVFNNANFGVNGLIALALIFGAALLAMVTATLVAWGSVRVRPLEVLRYE